MTWSTSRSATRRDLVRAVGHSLDSSWPSRNTALRETVSDTSLYWCYRTRQRVDLGGKRRLPTRHSKLEEKRRAWALERDPTNSTLDRTRREQLRCAAGGTFVRYLADIRRKGRRSGRNLEGMADTRRVARWRRGGNVARVSGRFGGRFLEAVASSTPESEDLCARGIRQ